MSSKTKKISKETWEALLLSAEAWDQKAEEAEATARFYCTLAQTRRDIAAETRARAEGLERAQAAVAAAEAEETGSS